jgi:hypothetical protein
MTDMLLLVAGLTGLKLTGNFLYLRELLEMSLESD